MKRQIWLIGLSGLIGFGASLGVFLLHRPAGLIMAGAFLAIAGLWLIAYYRRDRAIKHLSTQLRRLLSGEYVLDFSQYEEGELAVLAADLYKLMTAFREQQASLLADKTWLADAISDISHQLKTPITSMMMLTDLLKKDLEPDRRRQFLNQLSKQTDRLQWLVKNLLTLSKLDAQAVIYSPAEVTYQQLFDRALEPLLINLELKNQSVELTGELSDKIVVDENWLAESLTNIIKNASDHGAPASPIQLIASERPMSHTIEVINQGEIAPQDLPHLFTRFYRGQHTSSDSVGIGLAISRAIVVQQGGQIEVESKAGQTIFRIRFPK